METSENSSLTQGLRIIRLSIDREKWGRAALGVTQIAEELDIDRSRASRLTQELCELGLLEKAERGAFRAGRTVFDLGNALNFGWALRGASELRRIATHFAVDARLSVRQKERVVLVRADTGTGRLNAFAQPGMITPVWCTGAGRALLWDLTPADIAETLKDVNFVGVGGPNAAHTVTELNALQERDRPRGLVHASEEFEHGVLELAVPVRGSNGKTEAALSVLGNVHELGARLDDVSRALQAAAGRLGA